MISLSCVGDVETLDLADVFKLMRAADARTIATKQNTLNAEPTPHNAIRAGRMS